ncbi:hypothetical protein [Methylobacterium sp. A54F]
MKPLRAVLLASLLLAAGSAAATEAVTRYRGTVESRDGETLTLRLRDGGTVVLEMNPRTRMFTAVEGRLRDVKPESYVSVLTEPGTSEAAPKPTAVTIYSPSERGFMAGSRPWDTAPGATLTAGWIDGLDRGENLRVNVAYDGGAKTFTVPEGTPTVQIATGEKGLLVPGAQAVAFSRRAPDGTLQADLVAVGRLGAEPRL